MSHVLEIGHTKYYVIRKGPQQYCVAEGRRVQDRDFCWQVTKDAESGRNFFINGTGVRRWHLPDIHQSETERREEEKALRFRRERKKEEERRHLISQQQQQQQGSGGRGSDDDDDDNKDSSQKGGDKEEKFKIRADTTLDGVEDQQALFSARDKAARHLSLLPGWETPLDRKPVVRFAKTVVVPYFHQQLLGEEDLSALIVTASREYCAQHKPPFNTATDGPRFEKEVKALVQARVDEETKRKAFQKMNQDLLDRVKRLDDERRELVATLNEMTKNEEGMRRELNELRAHKQTTLLNTFKRMTKDGLVKAYWERWTRFKAIVEADAHVNARERRAKEMAQSITTLEEQLAARQEEIEALRDAERQRQGKEVIQRILGLLGRDTLARFFKLWMQATIESRRVREMYDLQEKLSNCPRCVQRGVDVQTVTRQVLEAWQENYRQKRVIFFREEAEARAALEARSWRMRSDLIFENQKLLATFAQSEGEIRAAKETIFEAQERKMRLMTREMDNLKYELAASSALHADEMPDDDGGGGGGGGHGESFDDYYSGSAAGGAAFASSSPGGGGGGAPPNRNSRRMAGGNGPAAAPAAPVLVDQHLSSFMQRSAARDEEKLHQRLTGNSGLYTAGHRPPPSMPLSPNSPDRHGGGSNSNSNSVNRIPGAPQPSLRHPVHDAPRGMLRSATQSAIAPNVFESVSNNTNDNMPQQPQHQQQQNSGKTIRGGKYEPVLLQNRAVNNITAAANAGGGPPSSAFDMRTQTVLQKKEMDRQRTTNEEIRRAAEEKENNEEKSRRRTRGGEKTRDNLSSDDDSERFSSTSSRSSSSPRSSSSSSTSRNKKRRRSRRENRQSTKKSEDTNNEEQRNNQNNISNNNNNKLKKDAKEEEGEPLSRFMIEKSKRAEQAEVLRFIKAPLSREEALRIRQRKAMEAAETEAEQEARRCKKCGFRLDSAAFCPVDGHRHEYRALNPKLTTLEDLGLRAGANTSQQHGGGAGGGQFLPASVARMLQTSSNGDGGGGGSENFGAGGASGVSAPIRTHHDDNTGVLVMPERYGSTISRLFDPNAKQPFLQLPPGMAPVEGRYPLDSAAAQRDVYYQRGHYEQLAQHPHYNNDPTLVGGGGPHNRQQQQHPLVQKLRGQLNLNPYTFDAPLLYRRERGGGGGGGGDDREEEEVQLRGMTTAERNIHALSLNVNSLSALEQEAVHRQVVDQVRSTRITTENTRKLLAADRAPPGSHAAAESMARAGERSVITGYNPSADMHNALSLNARLFSSPQQQKQQHQQQQDRQQQHNSARCDDEDGDVNAAFAAPKMDVPNYFMPTMTASGAGTAAGGGGGGIRANIAFASRSGNFDPSNTVPDLVREKMTRTIHGDTTTINANNASSMSRMNDSQRVQNNLKRFNGSTGAGAGVEGRAGTSYGDDNGGYDDVGTDRGSVLMHTPPPPSSTRTQTQYGRSQPPNQQHSQQPNGYATSSPVPPSAASFGLNATAPVPVLSSNSVPAASFGGGGGGTAASHWGKVFEFNDVLFGAGGLGVRVDGGGATPTQQQRAAAAAAAQDATFYNSNNLPYANIPKNNASNNTSRYYGSGAAGPSAYPPPTTGGSGDVFGVYHMAGAAKPSQGSTLAKGLNSTPSIHFDKV